MSLLLERTDTIPAQEKSEIERQLHMYDSLWEESPRIQQERAKSKAEGELQAAQAIVVHFSGRQLKGQDRGDVHEHARCSGSP